MIYVAKRCVIHLRSCVPSSEEEKTHFGAAATIKECYNKCVIIIYLHIKSGGPVISLFTSQLSHIFSFEITAEGFL